MSVLNDSSSTRFKPKYVGLAQILIRDIAGRGLKPGDRLSTENQLVKQYNLSRVTVRQALELLEKEGYVSRQRARGTFVERTVDSKKHIDLLSRGSVLIVCSNEQSTHREEDVAFATVLRAMEKTLARENCIVQILSVGQDPAVDRAKLLNHLNTDRLEGILAIGNCLEPYIDVIADSRVVSSCSFHSQIKPWVGQDAQVACYELIKHLLNQGHREIAMVCGHWVDAIGFGLFARGYQKAYSEAGVEVNRGMLFHAYPGESIEELIKSTLTRGTHPTAVFCENWRVCQAVLRVASHNNLSVPGDLSIVGYGQNVLELSDPVPITAYVPNSESIGEDAAKLLLKMIDGQSADAKMVTIPGRIVEGESVQPPA